jgi:hypothetical protein
MKISFKKIAAGLAGLLIAGVAASAVYYGYNPNTGLNGVPGLTVAGGPSPAVTGTCGTIPAPVGGAAVFQVTTAGVTTCTLTVTYTVPATALAGSSAAAPNGLFCVFTDETTAADANNMHQASHTTTSVTTNAATIVAGDNILVECNGY